MPTADHEQPIHRRRTVYTSGDPVLDRYPNAKVPPGFEALLDSQFEPIDIVNNFMLARVRKKSIAKKRWRNSQRADADDLAQFLIFLWATGVTLKEVTPENVETYALNISEGVSVWTARHLSDSTIRRRLSTLRDFFVYAHERGFFDRRMMELSTFKRSLHWKTGSGRVGVLEHGVAVIERPLQPHRDETIRPLSKSELHAVLNTLGPRDWTPGGLERRDRLVAEVAVLAGLRVSEIASLTIDDVTRITALSKGLDRYAKVRLSVLRSKNNRARQVVIPVYLVERLQEYVDGERAAVCEHRLERRLRLDAENALFLNSSMSNRRDVGNPTSAATLSYRFKRAVIASGLVNKQQRFILDEDGLPLIDFATGKAQVASVPVAAHSIHDLRHTFAIQLYIARKRAGDANPLKAVQSQLGHALSSTTSDTYLSWVDVFENELADQLSDFYAEIAESVAA